MLVKNKNHKRVLMRHPQTQEPRESTRKTESPRDGTEEEGSFGSLAKRPQ